MLVDVMVPAHLSMDLANSKVPIVTTTSSPGNRNVVDNYPMQRTPLICGCSCNCPSHHQMGGCGNNSNNNNNNNSNSNISSSSRMVLKRSSSSSRSCDESDWLKLVRDWMAQDEDKMSERHNYNSSLTRTSSCNELTTLFSSDFEHYATTKCPKCQNNSDHLDYCMMMIPKSPCSSSSASSRTVDVVLEAPLTVNKSQTASALPSPRGNLLMVPKHSSCATSTPSSIGAKSLSMTNLIFSDDDDGDGDVVVPSSRGIISVSAPSSPAASEGMGLGLGCCVDSVYGSYGNVSEGSLSPTIESLSSSSNVPFNTSSASNTTARSYRCNSSDSAYEDERITVLNQSLQRSQMLLDGYGSKDHSYGMLFPDSVSVTTTSTASSAVYPRATPPSVIVSDHSQNEIEFLLSSSSSPCSSSAATLSPFALEAYCPSSSSPLSSPSSSSSSPSSSSPLPYPTAAAGGGVTTLGDPVARDLLQQMCGGGDFTYRAGGVNSSRKLSNCSSCSWASTADEDEDGGLEERVEDVRQHCRPSGWKKVRNVVHWSPFIQTYKKQKYPWVQLAGHQGSFKAGNHGTILKKATIWEEKCLRLLMEDDLKPYVPDFKGQVEDENGEKFLRLEDLLADFDNPCVMDCKIGLRTYLEEELAKAKEKHKLRKDMYEKMIQVDPQAPSEEENQLRAVTKPRYMVWRETISSTATLAFRIEGIKSRDGTTSKDFKMTRSKEQVTGAISTFIENYPQFASYYIQRLEKIQAMLQHSQFFASHELIGSSLLFVHDDTHCNIWMIDFAKTHPVPQGISIDHRSPWVVGNHEDGYLLGLENLIDIFRNINATYRASTEVEKGDTTTTTTDCSAVNNTTTL